MLKKIFLWAFIMFVPQITNAEVYISEIMYDLEGTDSGREWIEIHNDSSNDIDLSTYYLYENEVAHKINTDNNSLIKAGDYAVIADSIQKFKEDWPSFSKNIFDSVFSLNNSGETISILDSSKNLINEISYNPEMGAKGNGNSLQYLDGNFVPGFPTPGDMNVQEPDSEISDEINDEDNLNQNSDGESAHSEQNELSTYKPKTKAKVGIGRNRKIPLNSEVTFEVFVSDDSEKGKFYWSLGDNTENKGSEIKHYYRNPGEYNVVLNAIFTDYKLTSRTKVYVEKPDLDLEEKDGKLAIKNSGKSEINLGNFILEIGENRKKIVKDTILSKGQSLIFDVLKGIGYSLYYPNGDEYYSSVNNEIDAICKELEMFSDVTCNRDKMKDYLLEYGS